MRITKQWLIAPAFLLLSSCASNPVDSTQVTVRTTPEAVVASGSTSAGTVMWGGVILSSANLTEGSQLEVLSYPLDHRQLPMRHRDSTGRFVIKHPEYLETVDYAPGRLVTVLGNLSEISEGKLGDAEYTYVNVVPESLYLWRKDRSDVAPAFSFGVGINISN